MSVIVTADTITSNRIMQSPETTRSTQKNKFSPTQYHLSKTSHKNHIREVTI